VNLPISLITLEYITPFTFTANLYENMKTFYSHSFPDYWRCGPCSLVGVRFEAEDFQKQEENRRSTNA
jgi:hypothetical protein